MISPVKIIGVRVGGGICSLLMVGAVLAAPPPAHNGILNRATEPGSSHASAGAGNRLDLTVPDLRTAAHGATSDTAAGFVPFPSPRRAGPGENARQPEETRELAAQGVRMTEESPAQQLARRFHREGLPVARLWQGHSALVSLGLNQRGKPGLWLTQKVP
jgi:hypothetical protein